ncbi:3-hydroxyacyl-CoA dehydrogenase NAD-binding domain-containing protein [Glaciimonas sp. PCH181]|uniref:3-hydroxyacyl-CoA dehydrogenase NAD-binding domain-containing protein n=1 Tax=Glaciimonas sp. PCH181 TaxID=2133943 RepID=UPI001CEC47D8|nr:3-hydroxyacyl-CoA dehydrogenase NAD-binding domain-containing protein [Glaciimonas sp. PCH181]
MKSDHSVVVIGGGTMGCDVAAIFYAAGWNAQIVEPAPAPRARLPESVAAAAQSIGIFGNGGSVDARSAIADIDWSKVGIVIECAPENLEIKQQIFRQLDTLAPAHVPLTSNSSGIPISQIGDQCSTRERMLGLHFFMPAHWVPAVEVIRSAFSDEAVAQTVSAIMRSVRKKPVQVKRDVPGFLANRIQHALMREAIALVDEGFASAEDVDLAVRYGFGFRYIAAGPLLQKDLAGVDIHCAAAAGIYPHLHTNTAPSPLMQNLVDNGDFGVKSASRKGFYDWDEATIAREQTRYQIALKKAMQILRDEDDGEAVATSTHTNQG